VRVVFVFLIAVVAALAVLAVAAVRAGAPGGVFLIPVIAALAALVVAAVLAAMALRRKAARAGYASIGDYLRAVPRSEQEQREAVDLALQGLMCCLVGLIVPPLILVGVFPLYYGARKVLYAQMGLALVDDRDRPGA
jgi:uncharacterized membrane protein